MMTDRERWVNFYNTTKREYDVCRWDYQLKEREATKLQDRIDAVRNMKGPMLSLTNAVRDREDDVSTKAGEMDDIAGDIKSRSNDTVIINYAEDIEKNANAIEDLLDSLLYTITQLESKITEMSQT
ncbi:MAG: hypothetical protein PHG85_05035 [Candidatus Altiarchaeota archaeon]|nr:hypothetical protein [Candidatus Altiarchaeota archaeon]